ncbi:hypothetical protein [Sorangium sp. So ce145]|uniref:hypothetical protein n=1 Tax=Sorangium sp. So ce145 TaxID=3133285 RepID=UPI003F647C44
MTDNYRAEQLFPIAAPQWIQGDDGVWVRDWEVRLIAAPDERQLDKLMHLSEEGIDVVATMSQDGRTIRLRSATRLNPFGDDIFHGSAYRMLRRIDGEIGRIELIQGQPRGAWQPFRQSTLGHDRDS